MDFDSINMARVLVEERSHLSGASPHTHFSTHPHLPASLVTYCISLSALIISTYLIAGAFGAELCSINDVNATIVTKDWETPCQKSFLYCLHEKGAIEGTCPRNLVFHPAKTRCALDRNCPKSWKKEDPVLEIETSAECPKKPCGLYPGNECNTYFLCSGGVKVHKKCSGLNVFDFKSLECKDPQFGKCWQEVSVITPTLDESKNLDFLPSYCPFHEFPPTLTTVPAEKSSGSGTVLSSPQVTSFGEWQPWAYCSKGAYFIGMAVWRRSTDADSLYDHAGVVSLGFKCENPLKRGNVEIIGQYAAGVPDTKWFDFLMCELGAAVGFQLSQQADQGVEGDDLATDSIRMYCSCGQEKCKQKPYHEPRPEYQRIGGMRGNWTTKLFCKEKEALCGFQTQMQAWKRVKIIELEKFDLTGMNQMRAKCCEVPPPGKCNPKESRIFVQACENRDSEMSRRCPYNATLGIHYNAEKYDKTVAFYESVGHSLNESIPFVKKSVTSRLKCEQAHSANNGSCAYDWKAADERVFQAGYIQGGNINVRAGVITKLFQVVANCGVFTIYTNKLVKVRENARGQQLADEPVIF